MKTKTASKKILSIVLVVLLSISMCFALTACKNNDAESPATDATQAETAATSPDEYAAVWADAVYTEDTVVGEGETTFYFEVQVGTHSVTFTVNTDETIVGKALLENNLIAGEEGPYGLYVKTVNGILADYDVNATYWGFNKDGEYMMTGVDTTDIENGAHYEMVYSK